MTPAKKLPAEDLCAQLAELRPVVARFLESTRVQQAAGKEGLDDETQDVMVEGYESLSVYRPECGPLVNWLLGIATNIRLRWRRACRKREERFTPTDSNDETPASQPSPEREAILSEACDRVGEALKTMPAEQRAVFSLVVFRGFSHAEVAQELGISEEASRMKFMRARAYIRKRVDDVHSAALLILCGQDRRVMLRSRWRRRLEFIYRAGHAWSALMAAALLGSVHSTAYQDVGVETVRAALARQAVIVRAAEPTAKPLEIGAENPATLDTPSPTKSATEPGSATPTKAAPRDSGHAIGSPPRGEPPRVPSRLTIKWRKSR